MLSTLFRSSDGAVHRPPILSLALALAVAFTAACRDADVPTDAPAASAEAALQSQVSEEETPSQESVASEVPGFGGYFLDSDGMPAVYLTDPAQRPAAEGALAGFLASRGFTDQDLRVLEADYDYLQLDAWHEQAWPEALTVTGAVLSDLDEGNNRLRFGGVDGSAVSAMRAAVAAAGVPADAYVVEQVPAVELRNTLRDRVRPVHGGYQVNFFNVGGLVTVSLICTMGFNAIPEGPEHEPVASFIVNSHCTQGEGDGNLLDTDYYQPVQDPDGDMLANPENLIGAEVHDPALTVSIDCPDLLPCRWADAARAEYAPGVPFELGRIARPAAFDPVLGTLEVDEKKPTFEIVDEQPFAVLGETAHKVGRTTGWTGGEVTATCVNTLAIGGVFVRRCQAFVAAGSDSGDSGSPVFGATNRSGNPANGKVILFGILWGGSTDDANPEFVYSPMFNIERELGLLQTH